MSETEPCLQPAEGKASIPGCLACVQSAIRCRSPRCLAATHNRDEGEGWGRGGGGRQSRQKRCPSLAACPPRPRSLTNPPGWAGRCSACPRSEPLPWPREPDTFGGTAEPGTPLATLPPANTQEAEPPFASRCCIPFSHALPGSRRPPAPRAVALGMVGTARLCQRRPPAWSSPSRGINDAHTQNCPAAGCKPSPPALHRRLRLWGHGATPLQPHSKTKPHPLLILDFLPLCFLEKPDKVLGPALAGFKRAAMDRGWHRWWLRPKSPCRGTAPPRQGLTHGLWLQIWAMNFFVSLASCPWCSCSRKQPNHSRLSAFPKLPQPERDYNPRPDTLSIPCCSAAPKMLCVFTAW